MNIEYGKILTTAWNITWKHKILWFFAFLLVLVTGNGGFSGSGVNYRFGGVGSATGTPNLPPDLQNFVNQLNQIDWSQVWGYIAIGVACLIILWIVFFVLSIIGQGGLLGGILQANSTG